MKVLLVAALLIPLFFINIRSTHDWGDDFAQYIRQAMNLAEGEPQTANVYIYNPAIPAYAPPVYPIGYPLMLAPVCYFFGNNLKAFNYFQTFLVFLYGLSLFYFFSKFMEFIPSLLLIVVAVYNPWMLDCKASVLSDIPFSLFFLLSVIAFIRFRENGKLKQLTFTSLLIGFTALIKPLGLILLPAFAIDIALRHFKEYPFSFAAFWKYIALLAMPVIIYFTVSFVFLSSSGMVGHFFSLYEFEKLNKILNRNSVHYLELFQSLFNNTNPDWDVFALVLKSFALVLFLLGFFGKVFNCWGIIELTTLFFLPLIILFPYTGQGFRYLLPLFPLMLLYIYHGYESINIGRLNKKSVFVAACLFCLFQYKSSVERLIKKQEVVKRGPQEKQAQQAFNFIIQNTSQDAVIAFTKPRALTLYTQRKCLTNGGLQDYESTKKFFEQNEVSYYLLYRDDLNRSLVSFLEKESQAVQMIWHNEQFTLYKKKSG